MMKILIYRFQLLHINFKAVITQYAVIFFKGYLVLKISICQNGFFFGGGGEEKMQKKKTNALG